MRDAWYMPTTWLWLKIIVCELFLIGGLLVWIGIKL
jgi:hypothetical protein